MRTLGLSPLGRARRGIVWALVALPLAALVAAAADSAPTRAQLMQQEKIRVVKTMQWAVAKKVSPVVYFLALYKPLADANRSQHDDNVRMAARYAKSADETLAKDETKAKQLAEVSKLYTYYAKQNKRVWDAFTAKDSGAIMDAFGEIKKTEKRIESLSGRVCHREWFMPDEVGAISSAEGGTTTPPAAKPEQEAPK